MDATLDGLWDWDVVTGSVYYSSGWYKILGEDSVGNDYAVWEKRIHEDDKQSVLDSLQNHLVGETENWAKEHRLKTKDNQWIWVLGRGKVVKRDSDNKPLRMVGTMTNITLFKEVQYKLQQSLKEIESLKEKEKETIYTATIYGTQHIVNNSLNQLQYIHMKLSKNPAIEPDILEKFDSVIKSTSILVQDISSVTEINEQNIKESIAPK